MTSLDSLGNEVAVKVLKNNQAHSENRMARLMKEGDIMYELRHPGICLVHNVGVQDNIPYIAMELIDGIPLSQMLKYTEGDDVNFSKHHRSEENLMDVVKASMLHTQVGRHLSRTRIFSLKNFFILASQIGDAISLAHRHKIIHRDIKPSNIMLKRNAEAVLMDFGLSIDDKEIGQQSSFGMEGTLDYMAPEVLSQRKPTSFQSDIYSFGSLLYMLLTGRKHFVRSSHILNDIKRLNEVKVLSPSQFNPLVTESMDDFIHKALEPNPENRFLSMHEMMEALHQVRRSMFSRSKKEPSMAKKISKWFK